MILNRDHVTWLMVADSVHTKVYKIHLHPFHLTAVPSDAIQGIDAVVQDLESDTHGGAQRHRKADFGHRVAHALNTAHERELFQDLILVAPAIALGDIRSAMKPSVHKAVILEITGEWAGLSEVQILSHLKHHLMPLATA